MAVTSVQTSKKYDFDSVGELSTTVANRRPTKTKNPIGIKTPLEFDYSSDSLFKMHEEISKQIRDNFKNLLTTNHGERLLLYDFGANLLPLAFEISTEIGDLEAIRRIKRAAKKYMPFVDLKTFEPLIVRKEGVEEPAKIGIRVIYDVPAIDLTDQGVEVTIYAAG
jgi:phage baseplate assembly protein W